MHQNSVFLFQFLSSLCRECGQEVQMRQYRKHAVESKCIIELQDIEDYDYCPHHGMSLPYVLTRRLEWDGTSSIPGPVFNTTGDGNWYLMCFNVRGVPFYLAFSFSATRQAFIICVIIADTIAVAQRYTAKLWLEESETSNPIRQDFARQVLSIKEVLDYEEDLPSSSYLILPYGDVKKYFAYTQNDGMDVWPDEEGLTTFCLPVQVKDITYSYG